MSYIVLHGAKEAYVPEVSIHHTVGWKATSVRHAACRRELTHARCGRTVGGQARRQVVGLRVGAIVEWW